MLLQHNVEVEIMYMGGRAIGWRATASSVWHGCDVCIPGGVAMTARLSKPNGQLVQTLFGHQNMSIDI